MATYHDLVGSGSLSELRDDSLRLALADFESHLAANTAYNDWALDQWVTQVTPFYIEHLSVPELYGQGRALEIGDRFFPGSEMSRGPQRFRARADVFWSREFTNLLAVRQIALGATREDLLSPSIVRIDTILRMIEKNRVP